MIDIEKIKAATIAAIECKFLTTTAYNEFLRVCPATAVLELITRLEAAEKDAARYRWLRNDPPATLAVRKFPGETPRGMYLDYENLDEAIDEAMKESA